MNWQKSRAAARNRHAAKYDTEEVASYRAMQGLGWLTQTEEAAYLADLNRVFRFQPGMTVLDVGAGPGTVCKILTQLPGLALTALEPSPAMLAILRSQPELSQVLAVEGFCDSPEDRGHFGAGQFQAVVSRQVVNGLFDPLTAFGNWLYWLAPGGAVVVIDGLYGRAGWTGKWQEEVDVLPLSGCQTLALTPYLLEAAGFQIEAVEWMEATNQLPTTKTPRYVVVGTKPGQK